MCFQMCSPGCSEHSASWRSKGKNRPEGLKQTVLCPAILRPQLWMTHLSTKNSFQLLHDWFYLHMKAYTFAFCVPILVLSIHYAVIRIVVFKTNIPFCANRKWYNTWADKHQLPCRATANSHLERENKMFLQRFNTLFDFSEMFLELYQRCLQLEFNFSSCE